MRLVREEGSGGNSSSSSNSNGNSNSNSNSNGNSNGNSPYERSQFSLYTALEFSSLSNVIAEQTGKMVRGRERERKGRFITLFVAGK